MLLSLSFFFFFFNGKTFAYTKAKFLRKKKSNVSCLQVKWAIGKNPAVGKLILLHSHGSAASGSAGENTAVPSTHLLLVLFLTADGKQDTENILKKQYYVLIFASSWFFFCTFFLISWFGCTVSRRNLFMGLCSWKLFTMVNRRTVFTEMCKQAPRAHHAEKIIFTK